MSEQVRVQPPAEPTAGEREFVERVAEHHFSAHGMPRECGRILGWLMICDPPRQPLDDLCTALGLGREQAEPFVEQMTLANVFVADKGEDGTPAVEMAENGWPHAVAATFASWPAFHESLRYGLEVLGDAPGERRRRLAELEELFRYLVTELPPMIARYQGTPGPGEEPPASQEERGERAPGAAGAAADLSEGERAFVEKIAEHYHTNDGMPLERGRVLGWLMICDPPEQSAAQLADRLGSDRDAVDRIVAQLVPDADHDGVFQRTYPDDGDDGSGGDGSGDYTVWMREGRWAAQVKAAFAGIPDFHRIVQGGLLELADAAPERRRRLERMEHFLGYLSVEIPQIWDRYEQQQAR
ncbi:MarR family transcriptional regulator [Streptomyces boncukensis]|uniref:MarR family transcriptional regulator n=1 Tax=Streptomyces boncukensis TaxID=2711219 RepID=A0A6G4X8H1_9ACTN|nr:MarR family transcriptional regulator [Streptomyces boncukensis]NGO73147.1 MarR family transcriptional regulator [Streptomyces boncukensis]